MLVTAEHRREWDAKGFFIVRELMPADTVRHLLHDRIETASPALRCAASDPPRR